MSYIAVDNLKHGMIVEQDVRDINNRLLLSKGQEITEKHLRVLKIWGVAEVSVVATADPQPVEDKPTDIDRATQIKESMDFLFHCLDVSRPTIHDVYRIAFLHRYRHGVDDRDHLFKGGPEIGEVDPSDNIHEKIKRIDIKLPEAPEIISELNAVIADPFATSNDIAQVVNHSPSLAALLLKLVNSAFYGFPTKIDRISRAVTIIGSQEISNLALGLCVMKAFDDIPSQVIDMASFMKHSFACGLMARIMGARLDIKQTEQLFVAGLLHDIGKLIVYRYFPKDAAVCLSKAGLEKESVFETEKKVLGLHHTSIGRYLVRKWQLPAELEDVIVHHHSPATADHQGRAGIVQMADLLANALSIGSSGEWVIPGFDDDTWSQNGLVNSTLSTIVRQALHQLNSMEAAFNTH